MNSAMIHFCVWRRIQHRRGFSWFFRDEPSGGLIMKKTSILLLLFFGAALLVSMVITPGGTRAADSSKIAVFYSGNLLGYTEPCG